MRMNEAVKQRTAWNHLLVVADSKAGKTHWIIQAAKDGYELLYIDNDNGYETIQRVLADDPEAMGRIHYFSPTDPLAFLTDLFTTPSVRYNETLNEAYSRSSAKLEHEIAVIRPARLVGRNVILVVDSWTTVVNHALNAAMEKQQIDASQIERYGREIYGGVNMRLTNMLAAIQRMPLDIVVLAHADLYEQKERPKNTLVDDVNEKDMRIIKTQQIPMSSSRPHGATMGKYFSAVGWITVGRGSANRKAPRTLDFTAESTRISGGATDTAADADGAHRYSKLWPLREVDAESQPEWIRYTTFAQLEEERKGTTPTAQSIPNKPTGQAKSPLAGIGKK